MKIAVEGCAHGELDKIYGTLKLLEERENVKIDLLICCGDFQASRNPGDLHCMAVPPKFRDMCSFYKYYSGEKVAPYLTVFIGGNHEASNYLQELPYGGWVAPNIYYLGYAGVVRVGGLRLGGLSGIYKYHDFLKGHHEHVPYDEQTKRSVYHVRNIDVFRLKQLSPTVDLFLSHDWPRDIWRHGDVQQLLRFKPFFKKDMESGTLGSKPAADLLEHLRPTYWFSAHLHCKFSAMVSHEDDGNDKKGPAITKFVALDKCLPKRRFLQVIDVPHEGSTELCYDLEWLSVLRLTNHLVSVAKSTNYMPGPNDCVTAERFDFRPTKAELNETAQLFEDNLIIPSNFVKTADVYDPEREMSSQYWKNARTPLQNEQTMLFCRRLGVVDPLVLLNVYEGTGDENCMSLSQANLTAGDDEAGDATMYPTFVISTPKKLGSLSLPEPKFFEDSEEDRDPEDHSCLAASNNWTSEVDKSQKKRKSVEENKAEEEKTILTASNLKSEKKVFKRRNASIYGNEQGAD